MLGASINDLLFNNKLKVSVNVISAFQINKSYAARLNLIFLKVQNVLSSHDQPYRMSIRFIFPVRILMLLSLFTTAQNIPKTYVAHRINEPIEIDGTATETSWEKAEWTSDFIDIEGIKKPTYRTRLKMLWDADYLYFYAQMQEPHVWGTLKQRDTVIFYNNDFEIFIDPDGDTHNYMELEINALNTVWDLFLTKPYRNKGKVIDSWHIEGLKSAVHVKGSLNDSSDKDTDWSVEIAIPWSVAIEASNADAPPKNDFWRLNFSRVHWNHDLTNGRYTRKKDAKGNYVPEYNWVWSPQGVVNMHEPEHWGYVYFSDESVGSTVAFDIPKDEHVKWLLYENYRKLLNAGANFEKVAQKISGSKQTLMGKTIGLVVEKYSQGWLIRGASPFSNAAMIINKDGKFETYEKQK